ncbi:MAG: hypothetical protein ACLGJB_11370, partial [Blastocatellia bacterium]
FLIFVCGPGGCSRDLTTLPAGAPAGCALGNEQGVTVTFTCNAANTPPTGGGGLDLARVTGCKLDRDPSGTFSLDITGTNFKTNATVTVGGVTPKKIKFKDIDTGSNAFTRITVKKRICDGLPGAIVVTNPGTNGGPSQPFQCGERCPTN